MSHNPFRYFKTSREIIQLAVMMYARFSPSLHNVEDLLNARGIDICYESIRLGFATLTGLAVISDMRVAHYVAQNDRK